MRPRFQKMANRSTNQRNRKARKCKSGCAELIPMIIRTVNIMKIYRVGVERINALRGVNIEIEPNDFVAIMGASGSGKSTLMNIIGCLDQPSEGQYILNGRDVSRMGSKELAEVRNQ